jgi:hypothetical protein
MNYGLALGIDIFDLRQQELSKAETREAWAAHLESMLGPQPMHRGTLGIVLDQAKVLELIHVLRR